MIYFASALFSEAERMFAEQLVAQLEADGHLVYWPWRDAGDSFYGRLHGQGSLEQHRMIYSENEVALRRASMVIAMGEGADVESGVSWEIGFASAIKTPVSILRTDFRNHLAVQTPLNIMLQHSSHAIYRTRADLLQQTKNLPRYRRVLTSDPVEFYNFVGEEYDDLKLHPKSCKLRSSALELSQALLPKKQYNAFLDVGGGSSRLAGLINASIRIHLEPSTLARELAEKSEADHTGYVSCRFEEFSAPRGAFDLISNVLVIDHINDLEGFFKRAHSLLSSKGLLVITAQLPGDEAEIKRAVDRFEFTVFREHAIYSVPSRLRDGDDMLRCSNGMFRLIATEDQRSSLLGVADLRSYLFEKV